MTLRQTANGKNETFAFCLQRSVKWNQNICTCGEQQEAFFSFCVVYLRITRKQNKIRSNLCRLSSAVNVMLKLSNKFVNCTRDVFSPNYIDNKQGYARIIRSPKNENKKQKIW